MTRPTMEELVQAANDLEYQPPRKLPLATHLEVTERVRNGEKLREIAPWYGVTGERIRQVAAAVDPQAAEVGRSVRAALKRERAAVLAEVRGVQRALRRGPCRICGGPVVRSVPGQEVEQGKATCSRRCHDLWAVVRYHLDDHERQIRLNAHARWLLRNSTDPVKLRYAQRLLAGTSQSRGRWYQQGSSVPAAMREVEQRRDAIQSGGESWWT